MEDTTAVVEITNVSKSYRRDHHALQVLHDITFRIASGEFLALMGPSGSGKSTLLNLIAGIDKPDSGVIQVAGVDIASLSETELAGWRATHVGFIFQFYNLIPVLTAMENVELPLNLMGLSGKERREHSEMALKVVNLIDRKDHYPGQLSGGEQQRVAIARAVVTDPTILVADEPTGDLDRNSADDVLNLMEYLNRQFGKTIIIAIWKKVSSAMLFLKLLFRNTFRHKLRTGLTILGIAIAILAFGMLRTMITAWYAGVEASSAGRLVTRNAISLIFPLPLNYKDKIRQVSGVSIVSFGNWFGGIYIDEKNFFANFAVEPKSYLELYPEFILPNAESDAFLRDRKGFIAGRKLAEKYGWKIGSTVTLKGTIYPGNWEGYYLSGELGLCPARHLSGKG